MKTLKKLAIATLVASTMIPAIVMAQSQDTKNQGYLVSATGSTIVTSGTGLCWHDSDWTPARGADNCDPTNKPVAAVVSQPVVVAATPVKAETMSQKISFSGDALFAFDKAVIKPEGKTMLNGLVKQLDSATYDIIVVSGHADRLGSPAYNQKLSERRAQAVKDYLVSKNIKASRINAEGKGESQPVTKSADCKGAKSAKVISCLQADRRVDVEMQGTKTIAGS